MQCLTILVLCLWVSFDIVSLYQCFSVDTVGVELGMDMRSGMVPSQIVRRACVPPPRERQISKAVKTGCPCSHSYSDHFLLQRSEVTVCGALAGQHAGSLRGEDVWVETAELKMEELKKN